MKSTVSQKIRFIGRADDRPDRSQRVESIPRKGWFLRRAAELLGTHRDPPEVNPLLP